MISHFDNVLRHLFIAQLAGITDAAQVGFRPPDEDWRAQVANLENMALNVYLADLRENRKLRSNERVRTVDSGVVNETPAPRRIDCHYLITAWSPATVTPAIEPTLDEHALLNQVIGILFKNEPLVPSKVFDPDPLPPGFPEEIANIELPTTILPVEGFPKHAEFWGTMGVNHRWKPAVYLVVTLPVILPTTEAGYMVTTRITEYRQTGKLETAEVWIQIGGHVLDKSTNLPKPIVNAWVRLEKTTGEALQTTTTNALGRFTFDRLQPGQYQLVWRAQGFPIPAGPRLITVPSPTGEYDLTV